MLYGTKYKEIKLPLQHKQTHDLYKSLAKAEMYYQQLAQ